MAQRWFVPRARPGRLALGQRVANHLDRRRDRVGGLKFAFSSPSGRDSAAGSAIWVRQAATRLAIRFTSWSVTVWLGSAGMPGWVLLLVSLLPELEKHRDRRAELDRNPGRIDELVQLGTRKAQAVAEQTMESVRAAMKLG